ncbi:alpha/beta hydrolase family protein [Ruania rhizosphaerae]|uniref:alpha/beta hydrolase family protein n=1 Tax=Ruania rhizosphaerae TaxID=1840413 RepID=UPI00135C4128|nr:S9 family peptidase [Ruania rhizosphaerae]
MRPEHLNLFRQLGTPAAHPSGTWAVVAIDRPDTDADTYPSALWRLSLDSGELRPFTHGPDDSEPVFSPDGRWLAFIRALSGGKPQVALIPADGGEPRVLTAHPAGVSGRPMFSPDSTRLAYTARVPEQGRYGTAEGVGSDAEAPRHITRLTYRTDGLGYSADRPQQVFLAGIPSSRSTLLDPLADPPSTADDGESPHAVAGVEVTQVTTEPYDHSIPVWTPDGTGLLTIRSAPDAIAGDLLHHRAEAQSPATVLEVGSHAPGAVTFDATGRLWLLLTDQGPDRMDFIGRSPALYRAALEGTTLSGLTRLTDPRTLTLTGVLEPAGDGVFLVGAKRGTAPVLRADGDTVVAVLDGHVEARAVAAMPDGAALVAAGSPDSVADLWHIPADAAPWRVTDLSARLRQEAGAVEPVELIASGDDGYPVHGWVSIPEGDGPHPVLLLIHGGPAAQYTPMFFDEVQVYTRAGYAVVFCNPRGSIGYGQDHARAIIGGFGGRDAVDVLAFLDAALAAHPQLDAERVGVLGGSYGGYMTAWLTTQTRRFAAAIVERGFLDPVSFVGSADIGWFFPHAYLGTDPEQIAAQSPMAHVDRVRTPTLVIHSERDWRCPVEQGQRWYTELRLRDVEAELLLFPGEGHELSRSGRPRHRVARFEHILRWWAKHLPVT